MSKKFAHIQIVVRIADKEMLEGEKYLLCGFRGHIDMQRNQSLEINEKEYNF